MRATEICYRNFRNIANESIKLDSGVNVFYGDNAQGKTNALEGIFLMAQGRSFRTVHEKEFIGPEGDFFSLSLTYEKEGQTRSLGMKYTSQNKKFCLVNRAPVRRMSEFVGNFRAVLFCPSQLSLVRGGPGERRSFIDGAISQTDTEYMFDLSKYNAILNQRNALLPGYFDKRPGFGETMEILSAQLAEQAERIAQKRDIFISSLEKTAAQLLTDMTSTGRAGEDGAAAGGEKLRIVYKKPMKAEEYMRLLTSSYEREARFGSTMYGIHKDEAEITLDGMSARAFCSQGQQRSIVLAIKMSQAELSRKATGEYPVMLLDDVLSELDEKRRSFILSGFDGRQVIITCCDPESSGIDAGKGRSPGGRFRVEKGKYYRT